MYNKHKRRTSVPCVGFEAAIPGIERPQNFALDRMKTGIGIYNIW